jgi:hypothetical protein
MKVIFDYIVKILLVVLFAALIYEFHVFIEEYKNHDRYYINLTPEPYPVTLFDKRTGNIYKPQSGQWELIYSFPKR